jgi:tRNA(Ile)-lysidine synthetase-like protein
MSENFIWVSLDEIADTVIARSRISGDCIQLVEGSKSIKKLFNDWGVNPKDRWKIPVIEDKTGIIAVLGKPFGFNNRIAMTYKNCSSDTKKLVISASYMEKHK